MTCCERRVAMLSLIGDSDVGEKLADCLLPEVDGIAVVVVENPLLQTTLPVVSVTESVHDMKTVSFFVGFIFFCVTSGEILLYQNRIFISGID